MKPEYKQWLIQQGYVEGTQNAQLYRVQKVEDAYGCLDEHHNNNTYQNIVEDLTYSTEDERSNKPNTSKIILGLNVNIRNNLASYKMAAVFYQNFLNDNSFQSNDCKTLPQLENLELEQDKAELSQQRFALERDMQSTLRNDISSLEASLTIIDVGKERIVNSGLIDITCEDSNNIVVIELKAGKADSRAIGQILGYMGDIQDEEERNVRGILIAHDFDKRAEAAARVVPTLTLKKYSIEFKFLDA